MRSHDNGSNEGMCVILVGARRDAPWMDAANDGLGQGIMYNKITMKNMRVFYIRMLAVYMIVIGLWNGFHFFQGISVDGIKNLAYLVTASILIKCGMDLFALKEFGRKLALAVMGIYSILILFVIFLAVSMNEISFTWIGLGTSIQSGNASLFFAIVIPVLLITVLSILLLLNNKTQLVFQK